MGHRDVPAAGATYGEVKSVDLSRFAFSTNAFSRQTLKKALKRVARTGFKGVEILADKPHVWLDSFGPRDISRLERQLDKLGLFLSNINASRTAGFWSDAPQETFFEPSLISRSRTLREWRIAYTKKALRLGKALGAHNVSVVSGALLPGVPPEKAQKLLEESLKRLIEEAEHLGQRFSIELAPSTYIERTSEAVALVKKMNSALFGVNLDVGHAQLTGEDPTKAIRDLKDMIFHIHLEDIRGHKHYHRIPGDGDIDFRGIARELDRTGYTGPLTWDLYTCDENPDEAVERSYKYSRTLLLEMQLGSKPKSKQKTAAKTTRSVKK